MTFLLNQSWSSSEEDEIVNDDNDHINLISSNDDICQIPSNGIKENNKRCQMSLLFPPNFFIFEAPSRIMQARMAMTSSNWNRNVTNGMNSKQKMFFFRILFASFHLNNSSMNQYDSSLNRREMKEDKKISINSVKNHIEYLTREALNRTSNEKDEFVDFFSFEVDLHLSVMMPVCGMQLLQLCENEKNIVIHYEKMKCLSIQEWKEFIDTPITISTQELTSSNSINSRSNFQTWWIRLFDYNKNNLIYKKQPKTLYDCLNIMCRRVDDCLLLHTKRGSMTVEHLLLQKSPLSSFPSYRQHKHHSVDALTLMNENEFHHQTLTNTLKKVCHSSEQRKRYFDVRQISSGFNRIFYKYYYLHLIQNYENKHNKIEYVSTNTNDVNPMKTVNQTKPLDPNHDININFIPNMKWGGLHDSYSYNKLFASHQINENNSIDILHSSNQIPNRLNHLYNDIDSDSSDCSSKKIRYRKKRMRLKRGV